MPPRPGRSIDPSPAPQTPTPPPAGSPPPHPPDVIAIRGARQHNLKHVDLDLPLGQLTVVTGPSGSGKSSLAFHTLYAEGQRRYVETFSPYVRQFFDRIDKPAVDRIDGIPPAIAIEQKNNVRTTRSTVGTLTEINDYLKLLFARAATGHDPHTGQIIRPDTPDSAAAWTEQNLAGQTILVTFPVPVPPATSPAEFFALLHQQAYLRVLLGSEILRTDETPPATLKRLPALVAVLQDRLRVEPASASRLREALETAFLLGKGSAGILPAVSRVSTETRRPTPDPTAPPAHKLFSATWHNPDTGFTLRAPVSALFSFNNPLGACPKCRGFGRIIGIDLAKTVPDPSLSLAQGAVKPFQGERGEECQRDLLRCCRERRIDTRVPWEDLDPATQNWVWYGDGRTSPAGSAGRPPLSSAQALSDLQLSELLWQEGKWYGVKGFFDWLETKAYKMHVRVFLSRYRSYTTCDACRGQRLQPEALCFRIADKTLPDLWQMPVGDLHDWFQSTFPAASSRSDPSLDLVLAQIRSRLAYLTDVGLGYLTLDRPTRTLSGGEVERVNLTTCLGASLTNTLFVLDEPTVGLHPRDIHRLTQAMHGLRDKGNTLVVVEHEESVMRAADHIVDLGPAAGEHGGQLVYQGPPPEGSADRPGPLPRGVADGKQHAASSKGKRTPLKREATSSPATRSPLPAASSPTPPGTLPWLDGTLRIPVPGSRQPRGTATLAIRGASRHNLRKLDLDLPLGLFVCLTGVSGSGKSTLARDVIHHNLARAFGESTEDEPAPLKQLLGREHLTGVRLVDQSPLARTPRSTPAVLCGAFDLIRQLFAGTDQARAAGLTPGFFSFNSGEGRCDRCAGNGFEKVEMQFLSDLYVTCPDCNGRRFRPTTLDHLYLEKSIADVLDLTVDEAIAFFLGSAGILPATVGVPPKASRRPATGPPVASSPKPSRLPTQIVAALTPLAEVGLGYLKLGQPLNTLSGGESQRLKLCQLLPEHRRPASVEPQPSRPLSSSSRPSDNKQQATGSKGKKSQPKREAPSPLAAPSPLPAASSQLLLILDEPTTGLHFSDIEKLLVVFRRLVENGHSLLVIEHNLDVIQCADWIIDLGPDAGARGGQIVAQGTPEQVAATQTETARFLRPRLAPGKPKPAASATPAAVLTTISSAPRSPAGSFPLKTENFISLRGAREHNLKNISLDIPRDQFVVVSGLSGSGKSTLAFDILFAEGQRRFLDSMSAYARQFAEQLEKPDIDHLAGLPPTVAIEQRVSQGGGKSTVATVTELWNFIRLLYAKLGTRHCPDCGLPVEKQSLAALELTIRSRLAAGPVRILAPVIRGRKGFHSEVAEWAAKQGFASLLVDGRFTATADFKRLERFKEHDIDVVVAELESGNAVSPPMPRAKTSGKSRGNPSDPARQKSGSLQASNSKLDTLLPRALEIGKGVIRLFSADKKFTLLSTTASCPGCHRSFDDLDPRLFSFNSPHGWCRACRGHGRLPKSAAGRLTGKNPPPGTSLPLDTSRFESVLEAELAADRQVENMEDEELVECPACHGTRLNPEARVVTLDGLAIADLARMPIDHAADRFAKLAFRDDRAALIARDILPEIRQRLAFLREVGLGYLQLDRSATTLSGGESQRIRLASQLGSNLRGVLYVLDEPTIGLHPRDNAALLDTLSALRNKGNSLLVVEHDEDTIRRADHLIDLGPGAGRLGGEVVYQGLPPGSADRPGPLAREMTGSGQQIASSKGKTAQGKREAPSSIATGSSLTATSPSPTLRALCHHFAHPLRGQRRPIPKTHPHLVVTGCRANNLKNLDLRIPLGRLTVLTGVSGSGKSSLMHGCLAAAADRAKNRKSTQGKHLPFRSASGFDLVAATHEVDQSPIGKTSRSCPATYVGFLDDIRKLFAQLPEARMRGYDASRFSFNTDAGRCPECKGNGRVKLEMDFLPPAWVPCEACREQRFNPATLEVTYGGHSIGDVLRMTVDEAAAFFAAVPRIAAPLQLLADTGLGYLQLGQASPTLSGGEAQRIKLVTEIAKGRGTKPRIAGPKPKTGNLYLIEEPTVGLHHEDVQRLIDVLHRLVDEGHTVVVIEHHMDVAAEADHLIDLGPQAGDHGGRIVAQGSPEHVARSKTSRTSPFLKTALTGPNP